MSLPVSNVGTDIGQLQAAIQASPYLAAAAMLNQNQAVAAIFAAHAAVQQAQVQAANSAAATATSVYSHNPSAVGNFNINQAVQAQAIAAMQAAAAAAQATNVGASPLAWPANWSDIVSMGQQGLKRKASFEQDSELVGPESSLDSCPFFCTFLVTGFLSAVSWCQLRPGLWVVWSLSASRQVLGLVDKSFRNGKVSTCYFLRFSGMKQTVKEERKGDWLLERENGAWFDKWSKSAVAMPKLWQ